MKREWNPLLNTFEINTRKTHKKALILFTDTLSKLKNEQEDPQIAQILALIQPIFSLYEKTYQEKQLVAGTYEAKTMKFEIILTELTTKIRYWEGKVHSEFIEGSIEDRNIFPNRRTPFVNGTYENRRASVAILAKKLLEYPVFFDLSQEVQHFYVEMQTARENQLMAEAKSLELTDLLEQYRIEMCNGLYAALGLLMFKHHNNPSNIARYFDLSLLRQTANKKKKEDNENYKINSIKIPAGKYVNLGNRPAENCMLYLNNKSTEDLYFYCSDFEDISNPIRYMLKAKSTFTGNFSQLFLANKKHWIVQNNSKKNAILEIEIFEAERIE